MVKIIEILILSVAVNRQKLTTFEMSNSSNAAKSIILAMKYIYIKIYMYKKKKIIIRKFGVKYRCIYINKII